MNLNPWSMNVGYNRALQNWNKCRAGWIHYDLPLPTDEQTWIRWQGSAAEGVQVSWWRQRICCDRGPLQLRDAGISKGSIA